MICYLIDPKLLPLHLLLFAEVILRGDAIRFTVNGLQFLLWNCFIFWPFVICISFVICYLYLLSSRASCSWSQEWIVGPRTQSQEVGFQTCGRSSVISEKGESSRFVRYQFGSLVLNVPARHNRISINVRISSTMAMVITIIITMVITIIITTLIVIPILAFLVVSPSLE